MGGVKGNGRGSTDIVTEPRNYSASSFVQCSNNLYVTQNTSFVKPSHVVGVPVTNTIWRAFHKLNGAVSLRGFSSTSVLVLLGIS